MKPVIRLAAQADSKSIVAIYNHYILNSTITFEEEPITSGEMFDRINSAFEAQLPWLVAEHEGEILGYAYASQWKGRCAYRYSVESTIYLHEAKKSKGLGSMLYTALLSELRAKDIHVVLGGIALPNQASIGLHEKMGFEKVAHFKEVGHKFNKWVDVGYWQLTLNGG